jgi:hypothetical protein
VAIPKAVPAPVVASQIEPMSSAGSETDGVAVASADDFNELDVAADTVRVVAANELNEIDLAAQAAAPSAAVTGAIETVSSLPQLPADISWAGELFAALGGMLAAAAATRLLIA